MISLRILLKQTKNWLLAFRLFTLPLSIMPVLAGTILVLANRGCVNKLLFAATLVFSACIQIGTNLLNDAKDFERGNDTPNRQGGLRVTAAGLIPATKVKRVAILFFFLAALTATGLFFHGGWPVLVIGAASILFGVAYSAGPLPISYTPLGEVFVLFFFGPVAVAGTVWLHTGRYEWNAGLVGLTMGCFAAAVLHVNNTRDIAEDRVAGRQTLAILLGPSRAWLGYSFLFLLAFLFGIFPGGIYCLTALSVLPLSLALVVLFRRATSGSAYNRLLSGTVLLQILYVLLLAWEILRR